MMFQCVFEGSLSMQGSEIERRPYHKNCSCALHRFEGDVCSNACQRNISFPKKQSWSDSSLCMQAAASSRFSSHDLILAPALVLKHQIDFEEILVLCGVSFSISSTFTQV
ncbi:hypothetical protein ACE6H2_013901 [Prunus campanulata]